MNKKYLVFLVFLSVIFSALILVSCAPPGIPTFHDWSVNISFPYWGLPFSLLGLAVYFVPTIIAAVRRSKSALGIILLNIFAGWTFIGWIIALIWSLVGEASKK